MAESSPNGLETLRKKEMFDTQPGQDISETLRVSHPTKGEPFSNPEVASRVSMLYTKHLKEPRRSIRRRVWGLYLDLHVSESFSLMVHTIYAQSTEGPKSYKVSKSTLAQNLMS